MNMKKRIIIIIILILLISTGCKKNKQINNQTTTTKIKETTTQISETDLSLGSLISLVENCKDESEDFTMIKNFFEGLENDETINSCESFLSKINNNDEGIIINTNELISNGLITDEKEIEKIQKEEVKLICDVEIKKCNYIIN